MDPSAVSKETFRASLTRVLKRTSAAQKAIRQQQAELRSDLNACTQPVTLPPASLQAPQPSKLFHPPQEAILPANNMHSMAAYAPAPAPAGLYGQPEYSLDQPANVFQPASDNSFFILLHITDLYLANGLRALSPNQTISNLRLYVKSPPNTEEEITTQKPTYLIEYTRLKNIELSLVAELETTTGILDFQLGAAYINVAREIMSQLYRIDDYGNKRRQFSRRRVNILFSEVVPIHAVTISSTYSGKTEAIAGSLLIGAVGVSILCGGQPLLEYEQTLRAKPCTYLNMTKYVCSAKLVDKAVSCALETPADLALYNDIAMGKRELPKSVKPTVRIDPLQAKNGQPQQAILHKVAAVCCVARVSRVFLENPSTVEKLYAIATLQPGPELAAIIGYRLTQVHKLEKSLWEAGTSTAVRTTSYKDSGQNLIYADAALTISRKLALIPANIDYLLHGALSISVFGFGSAGPKKIFLGSVEVSLAECYSSGITVGGWFSLSNSPYNGYVYAEVSIDRAGEQENANWNSAEAPEPPTFAPPAFAAQNTAAPAMTLVSQAMLPLNPMYADQSSNTQYLQPPPNLKEMPVPLLKPDAGVYKEIGSIISELNELFTKF